MKKIIALVLCISLLAATLLTYVSAAKYAEDPSIIATYEIKDGVLTAELQLVNNRKGLNNLVVDYAYDAEELEIVSVENGEIFNEANGGSLFDVNTENNPIILYFEENSINNIKVLTGVLVTLKFNVLQEKDSYDMTFSVDPDSTFSCAEGSVMPVDAEFYLTEFITPGDLNGDGFVTAIDSSILIELLLKENYSSKTQEATADLNHDGVLTSIDSMLMIELILNS